MAHRCRSTTFFAGALCERVGNARTTSTPRRNPGRPARRRGPSRGRTRTCNRHMRGRRGRLARRAPQRDRRQYDAHLRRRARALAWSGRDDREQVHRIVVRLLQPNPGTNRQTTRRARGTRIALPASCNGTYGIGSDQKTHARAPCRLQTWDGTRAPRLYWQIAWELFRPEVLEPTGRRCPFAVPGFS